MDKESLYDVTIIGGGPVGLFTAFYSGMRNMKTKVIEAKSEFGGLVHYFSNKTVGDIGGIPKISGSKLIEQLKQQALTFEPTIVYNQLITGLQKQKDGTFLLESSTDEIHYTRAIILTVGKGVISPVKLELDQAELYEGRNLHYSVQDLYHFKDKHILISGGGDSAVDWANELSGIAKSVTVIHRRKDFRALEQNVYKMKQSTDVLTPYILSAIKGIDNKVKQVTITHAGTGEKKRMKIDELLINHGYIGEFGGIEKCNFKMNEGRFVVNEGMETSINGIFAAGDAVIYPNKLNLIAGGFAE